MKTGSPTKSIPIFTQFFLPSLACFFLQCQLDLSITVVCLIGLRSINRSIAVFASICFTAASKYGCEVWWKFIKNSTQLRTHFASRYRSKLESWWTLHHPPRNDPAEHYLPHLVLCCRLAHPSTLHSVTLSVTLLRPRAKSEKEILDAERKVSKKKKRPIIHLNSINCQASLLFLHLHLFMDLFIHIARVTQKPFRGLLRFLMFIYTLIVSDHHCYGKKQQVQRFLVGNI